MAKKTRVTRKQNAVKNESQITSQVQTVKRKKMTKNKPNNNDISDNGSSSEDNDVECLVSAAFNVFSTNHSNHIGVESESDSDDMESATERSLVGTFTVDKGPGPKEMSGVIDSSNHHAATSKDTLGDNTELSGQRFSTLKTSSTHSPTTTSKISITNKKNRYAAVTSLDSGIDMDEIYVSVNPLRNPSRTSNCLQTASQAVLLKGSVVGGEFEKQHKVAPYAESSHQLKKQRRAERAKSNGKSWFDMPLTEMTDTKKNDLMVLQMRHVLDPKRFYKAPDIRALPKFFQMGRVVEGPADFYNSRVPKKQRKSTLVDELLEDADFRKYNKRKYAEVVENKKGLSAAYKHMKKLKKRMK